MALNMWHVLYCNCYQVIVEEEVIGHTTTKGPGETEGEEVVEEGEEEEDAEEEEAEGAEEEMLTIELKVQVVVESSHFVMTAILTLNLPMLASAKNN